MRIFRFLPLIGILLGTAQADYFSGPGVGIKLGANFATTRHAYSRIDGATYQSLASAGFAYGVLADYMTEVGQSRLIIGGEVYANKGLLRDSAPLRGNSGALEGTVTLKHQFSLGGLLKAGMMLNRKVAGYIGAGVESGRFSTTYNNVTFSNSKNFSYNSHSLGYVFTGGGMYRWNNFKIGLGYTYVKFSALTLRKLNQPFPDNSQRGLQVLPREHRIFLSLTYLLAGPKREN